MLWKPQYLHKEVHYSQGANDHSKDGGAGNDNNHGWEGGKKGAQEHEDSGGQDLINHVNIFGEAVDDAPYRCRIKERLWGVKFVVQKVLVQLAGSLNFPHGQS